MKRLQKFQILFWPKACLLFQTRSTRKLPHPFLVSSYFGFLFVSSPSIIIPNTVFNLFRGRAFFNFWAADGHACRRAVVVVGIAHELNARKRWGRKKTKLSAVATAPMGLLGGILIDASSIIFPHFYFIHTWRNAFIQRMNGIFGSRITNVEKYTQMLQFCVKHVSGKGKTFIGCSLLF